MQERRCQLFAALVVTAMTLAGCSTVTGEATMPKVVEPTVALDGLYRIVADGKGTSNGKPVDDLSRSDDQWAFRTACDENGCVATGAIVDPIDRSRPPRNVVVADHTDDGWSIVTVVADQCDAFGKRIPMNRWAIWDVAVSPSKELSLNITEVETDACNSLDVRTPTIVRVGDRPSEFPLPDPAEQPMRSPTPRAAAFRGDYVLTTTIRGEAADPTTENLLVTTTCLRVGDHCVTTAVDTESGGTAAEFGMFTVEFDGGKFVGHRRSRSGASCNGSVGGMTTETMTIELPPDPVVGPFPKLTGERSTIKTSSCRPGVDDLYFGWNG